MNLSPDYYRLQEIMGYIYQVCKADPTKDPLTLYRNLVVRGWNKPKLTIVKEK